MALFLLNHLGKRLRQAFDQIERLSNVKVTQKIASAFLSLFLEPIKKDSEIICLPVTSKEYANFLGLTPESFSRGITKLEDEGIIQRLGNNCFKIADKQRLFTQSEA
jgi:CRP/FNR family transcriptional regulator